MIELVIKKWGNSLAARIPKVIADMIQLEKDQTVTIEAKEGRIIFCRPEYSYKSPERSHKRSGLFAFGALFIFTFPA